MMLSVNFKILNTFFDSVFIQISSPSSRFFRNYFSPALMVVYCGLFFINSVSAEKMNPNKIETPEAFGQKESVTLEKIKKQ